ncbi:MAG: beta-lactamase family protein [Oceanicaulis sp.]|nr:beta-lactamase family protein [Oceanicaulis sp.]
MAVASIGKVHTAAVIHSLIAEGLISLDDRLADLVAPYWVDGIANAQTATVRQLLTHTSGIADYYDDVWFQTVNTVQGNTPQRTLGYIHGRPPSSRRRRVWVFKLELPVSGADRRGRDRGAL